MQNTAATKRSRLETWLILADHTSRYRCLCRLSVVWKTTRQYSSTTYTSYEALQVGNSIDFSSVIIQVQAIAALCHLCLLSVCLSV